jgi:hypothetical protein
MDRIIQVISRVQIASPATSTPIRIGHGPASRDLLVSLALSGAFVILLCLIFNPRWETNDDVAMSMVAHGYGIAAYGSPRLFFSNVLWGAIVRSLPSVDGLLGYSMAALLSLALAAAAMLYFLLRAGAGYIVGLLVLAVVFARPVLFPQFSITAGLLSVAAVLGLRAYGRDGSNANLIAACCLGLLAYLIRAPEFALVAGVGLPLLPWRKLARSRAAWLTAAGLAVCIACATVIDVWAYSEPGWQSFWQANWVRAPFTDFGAVDKVLQRPDVMQRLGLSVNDVRLMGGWFFADPKLMNPELLKTLLGEIPILTATKASFASGCDSVFLMFSPQLFPSALAGFLVLALFIRPSLLLAWVICLAAMFAVGVAGRADTLRVYIPLVSLLLVIPCATAFSQSRWKHGAVICVLLLDGVMNAGQLRKEVAASDEMLRQTRPGKFVSRESTVVWGGSLPFEYVFPVFTRVADLRDTRIYSLGVLTLAPFSVAAEDERAGKGLLARLRSEAGIPLIAASYYRSLLETYCIEHYGTPLRLAPVKKAELWTVMNASCAPADRVE